jgi:hypothetical protein
MKKSVYIPKEHLLSVLKNGRGKAYTTIDIMKDEEVCLTSEGEHPRIEARVYDIDESTVNQLSMREVLDLGYNSKPELSNILNAKQHDTVKRLSLSCVKEVEVQEVASVTVKCSCGATASVKLGSTVQCPKCKKLISTEKSATKEKRQKKYK